MTYDARCDPPANLFAAYFERVSERRGKPMIRGTNIEKYAA